MDAMDVLQRHAVWQKELGLTDYAIFDLAKNKAYEAKGHDFKLNNKHFTFIDQIDDDSGLHAKLLQDEEGFYYIIISGTNNIADLSSDASLWKGDMTEQGQKLLDWFISHNIPQGQLKLVTGHSLGGYLSEILPYRIANENKQRPADQQLAIPEKVMSYDSPGAKYQVETHLTNLDKHDISTLSEDIMIYLHAYNPVGLCDRHTTNNTFLLGEIEDKYHCMKHIKDYCIPVPKHRPAIMSAVTPKLLDHGYIEDSHTGRYSDEWFEHDWSFKHINYVNTTYLPNTALELEESFFGALFLLKYRKFHLNINCDATVNPDLSWFDYSKCTSANAVLSTLHGGEYLESGIYSVYNATSSGISSSMSYVSSWWSSNEDHDNQLAHNSVHDEM